MSKDLFENGNAFDLINNPDTEDYLALILTNTDFTNLQSLGVKNQIELIISLINKELEKKITKANKG